MSNYQGRLEDSQANKLLVTPHSMANIEDSDTASQIYTIGNMLVYNNRLCKVTSAIAQGDTLEIGTNIAYKGINDIGQQLVASDGKEFYFDVKDGTYGYYPSAAKVASEFVPFGGTSFIDFTHPLWVQDNITGGIKTYTHTDTSITEAILFITSAQNSTMTITNCTYEEIVKDAMYGYGTMWAFHLSNMNIQTTIQGYISSGANRYFLYPCHIDEFK